MSETWYVLDDGSAADPREVAPDKAGVLRHKDGRAVAYAPHGPRSRSLDPEAERAKTKPKAAPTEGRDMRPADDRRPYITRDAKTR